MLLPSAAPLWEEHIYIALNCETLYGAEKTVYKMMSRLLFSELSAHPCFYLLSKIHRELLKKPACILPCCFTFQSLYFEQTSESFLLLRHELRVRTDQERFRSCPQEYGLKQPILQVLTHSC